MQKVFQKTCPNMPKHLQNRSTFDRKWSPDGSRRHLEGLGGLGRPKWELWKRLLERLGAEALRTRLERRWRVQEKPREPEMDAKWVQNLVEKDVRHRFRT